MKRVLIVALAILKVAVVDTTDANAEMRLEQLFKQNSLEQVKDEKSGDRSPTSPAQALQKSQPKQASLQSANSAEAAQLPERDRLLQERFLIKIIPAQNW